MTDDPKSAKDRGSSSNSCCTTALSLGRCNFAEEKKAALEAWGRHVAKLVA